MLTSETVSRLFDSFRGTKVLIVGDVMLDAYIWGRVERISPEAPVPIVSVEKRENRLGGAANVALNLKSLGAEPVLCSVVGNDLYGNEFLSLLEKEGMATNGLVLSEQRKTTVKFRVIGNNTQLLRVDDETTDRLSDADWNRLREKLEYLFSNNAFKVIVFQDYDKGVISQQLIEQVVSWAHKKKIPVTVDPKKRNFFHYRQVTLFKPNLKEMQEGLNRNIENGNMEKVAEAVAYLQEKLDADMIMNTLSEHGVFIRWKDGTEYREAHHPAFVRNIADVSGAGDTVISVASLCLAAGLPPDETAAVANLAGGLVCEEVGVVSVNKEKFKTELLEKLCVNN